MYSSNPNRPSLYRINVCGGHVLEMILKKALAKHPDDRFANAEELSVILSDYEETRDKGLKLLLVKMRERFIKFSN